MGAMSVLDGALERIESFIRIGGIFAGRLAPWVVTSFLDGRADDVELEQLGPLLQQSIKDATGDDVEVIVRRLPVKDLDAEEES
jgi:hypothetical protein